MTATNGRCERCGALNLATSVSTRETDLERRASEAEARARVAEEGYEQLRAEYTEAFRDAIRAVVDADHRQHHASPMAAHPSESGPLAARRAAHADTDDHVTAEERACNLTRLDLADAVIARWLSAVPGSSS